MKEDALELETRRAIYEYIAKYPGTYLRAIEKATGFQMGLLEYHLQYMEKHGILSSEDDGYRKRYFVKEEVQYLDKAVISILRQKTPREIIIHIMLNRRASFQEIQKVMNISKSTLSFHLKKMTESDMLVVEKEGRQNIYSVKDEERVARVLITYRQSFLDNVVDRFVDAWLEL